MLLEAIFVQLKQNRTIDKLLWFSAIIECGVCVEIFRKMKPHGIRSVCLTPKHAGKVHLMLGWQCRPYKGLT